MIIKNFSPVKLDREGYKIILDENGKYRRVVDNKTTVWYGPGLPVWEFDLYFVDSMRHYDTEFVRARDNRQAKRKIKRLYPWVERFEWGDGYAD